MQVHLTPEQEARLIEIAAHEGTTVDSFLTDITVGYLEDHEREQEVVHRRLLQADKGVFIEQEEMDVRVHKMLQQR